MPGSTHDDIKRALDRLLALGIRAPWQATDGPSRADVGRLWRDACDRASVDGGALLDAVDAWAADSQAGSRWWPSPADVLAHARRPSSAQVGGCGRCSAGGYASIAVHYDDRVERWYACCTCARGTAAADRSELPLPPVANGPRPRALTVAELATRYRQRDGVRAVYVHPSPGQLRLDLREPGSDPAARAKVEAILGSIREARGQPPHPADRWGD
jgi:hypothetical protein